MFTTPTRSICAFCKKNVFIIKAAGKLRISVLLTIYEQYCSFKGTDLIFFFHILVLVVEM